MTLAAFDKTAAYFPDVCFKTPPDLGILLGSGWGDSLAADEVLFRASYSDIPGIGDKTARDLLLKFGSVKEVRLQTEADLAKVVGPAKAKAILAYFATQQ